MGRSGLIAVLAAVLCVACSQDQGEPPAVAEGDERIACSLAGPAQLQQDCTVERVRSGEGLMLVVRHPNGAFRRFRVMEDGSGLAPADGALQAQSRLEEGELELAIGEEIYRFPATAVDHVQAP